METLCAILAKRKGQIRAKKNLLICKDAPEKDNLFSRLYVVIFIEKHTREETNRANH